MTTLLVERKLSRKLIPVKVIASASSWRHLKICHSAFLSDFKVIPSISLKVATYASPMTAMHILQVIEQGLLTPLMEYLEEFTVINTPSLYTVDVCAPDE